MWQVTYVSFKCILCAFRYICLPMPSNMGVLFNYPFEPVFTANLALAFSDWGWFQVEELFGWTFLHFKMINYWYSCWLSKLWTHGVPPIFTTDLQCFVLVPTVTNYETDSTWCDNNTSRSGLPAKVAEGNKWMYFFKEPKTFSLFPLAAILTNE